MVNFGELLSTRLHSEERTCSRCKHSREKFPRQTVVICMDTHNILFAGMRCDETRLDSRFSRETAHALAKEFPFSILFFQNASFIFQICLRRGQDYSY